MAIQTCQEKEYRDFIWFTKTGSDAAYSLFWTLAGVSEDHAIHWFHDTFKKTCASDCITSRSDFDFVASLLIEQICIRGDDVDTSMISKLLKVISEVKESFSTKLARQAHDQST